MSDNKYAVRIASPAGQVVLQMQRQEPAGTAPLPGAPNDDGHDGTDVETIVSAIELAAANGTAITSLEPDGERATMVIPGPGMNIQVLPWADHLQEVQRMRAAAAQRGSTPRIAMPRGRG